MDADAPPSVGQQSCSLIRQSEVPKPSTDDNGIILKISFAIAEDMHQNVVTNAITTCPTG